MNEKYMKQVALLVKCLPFIEKEECFAIKGGTAINLFCFDLPRLSVDIDLVYLPIENRTDSYAHIQAALGRISYRLERLGLHVHTSGNQELKLIVADDRSEIKIEPNYTLRGSLYPVRNMELCPKAQAFFGYATSRVIADAELWGGKICAALDRQHPRDLFDLAHLLCLNELSEEIKDGFLELLLAGNRPIHEILFPHDQLSQTIFEQEFAGMSDEPFTYMDAQETFSRIQTEIHRMLSTEDKEFLLNFVRLQADFSSPKRTALRTLPGVQWKILNLQKLQTQNKHKFEEQYIHLLTLFNETACHGIDVLKP